MRGRPTKTDNEKMIRMLQEYRETFQTTKFYTYTGLWKGRRRFYCYFAWDMNDDGRTVEMLKNLFAGINLVE